MGKQMMSMSEINTDIKAKAARIRAKKYDDAYLMERYRYYKSLYRASVEDNAGTTEPYIAYKAYETAAKERGLL